MTTSYELLLWPVGTPCLFTIVLTQWHDVVIMPVVNGLAEWGGN